MASECVQEQSGMKRRAKGYREDGDVLLQGPSENTAVVAVTGFDPVSVIL